MYGYHMKTRTYQILPTVPIGTRDNPDKIFYHHVALVLRRLTTERFKVPIRAVYVYFHISIFEHNLLSI